MLCLIQGVLPTGQPDRRGLSRRSEVEHVWGPAVGGGPATQLTKVTAGRIYDLEDSPDGKRLFLAKGQPTGDVVLIRTFR